MTQGPFRDAQEVTTTPWVNMVTFLQLTLSSLLPPTGLKAEAGSELPSSKMNTSQESAWGWVESLETYQRVRQEKDIRQRESLRDPWQLGTTPGCHLLPLSSNWGSKPSRENKKYEQQAL